MSDWLFCWAERILYWYLGPPPGFQNHWRTLCVQYVCVNVCVWRWKEWLGRKVYFGRASFFTQVPEKYQKKSYLLASSSNPSSNLSSSSSWSSLLCACCVLCVGCRGVQKCRWDWYQYRRVQKNIHSYLVWKIRWQRYIPNLYYYKDQPIDVTVACIFLIINGLNQCAVI